MKTVKVYAWQSATIAFSIANLILGIIFNEIAQVMGSFVLIYFVLEMIKLER